MMNNIAPQYQQLMGRLRHQKGAEGAILVAACKSQPVESIKILLNEAHRCFGENKVQEAASRWPLLREEFSKVELHLIGPLQSNKAADAVSLFDVIETIDRKKIADAINTETEKQKKRIECYIQVNIGREPQKGGVSLEELPSLVMHCRALSGLELTGLMCVPPGQEAPAPYFALMQKLAKEFGLKNLSMGMSGDFETALKFGATHVRIGTALFGERPA